MATDTDFQSADTFQGPAELRAAYDRAVKALKERDTRIGGLEVELKGHRIARAGFPEGSEGHRLLTDFFAGDLGKVEEMVEFAGKYGHKPATATPPPAADDEVERGDRTLSQLAVTGAPVLPKGETERLQTEIAKAEGEHRIKDAIRLKSQLTSLLRQTGKLS
jgi:hypothetical protein